MFTARCKHYGHFTKRLTDCDGPQSASRSCAPATVFSVMLGQVRSHFTFDLRARLITQLLGTGAIPRAHSTVRTPRGAGAVTEVRLAQGWGFVLLVMAVPIVLVSRGT